MACRHYNIVPQPNIQPSLAFFVSPDLYFSICLLHLLFSIWARRHVAPLRCKSYLIFICYFIQTFGLQSLNLISNICARSVFRSTPVCDFLPLRSVRTLRTVWNEFLHDVYAFVDLSSAGSAMACCKHEMLVCKSVAMDGPRSIHFGFIYAELRRSFYIFIFGIPNLLIGEA